MPGGVPSLAKSEEQKMMEKAMESCAFRAALACVGGFVLGGAFGVFTARMGARVGLDPKGPYGTPTAKEVLKDVGREECPDKPIILPLWAPCFLALSVWSNLTGGNQIGRLVS